jgi:hypothetical protein
MLITLINKHLDNLKISNIKERDSIVVDNYDEDLINIKYKEIMNYNIRKSSTIRILEYKVEYDLTENEKNAFLSHAIKITQEAIRHFDINDSDLLILYYNAAFIRNLSLDLNKIEYFYFIMGMIVDRLTQSNLFQLARDLGEEVLLISSQDNLLYWGFFIQFKIFNSHHISTEASIYLLCCLINSSKNVISDRYLENMLVNLHRFFRNFNLIEMAKSLYNSFIIMPFVQQFQLESISCSHFYLLLGTRDPTTIYNIYVFLNEHRESIINGGSLSALPWLNLIYSCYHCFPHNNDIDSLAYYKDIFERIIDPKDVDRLKAFSLGESDSLIDYYIELLQAHNDTRDRYDFASEMHNSIVLANKLILSSFTINNSNTFLLAMILKSDNSLLFSDKDVMQYLREAKIFRKDYNMIEEYHKYSEITKNFLSRYSDTSFCWMGSSGGNIYLLTFENGEYLKINIMEDYTLLKQKEWIINNSGNLSFNDTIKVAGQIFPYLEEDQIEDLKKLQRSLYFTRSYIGSKKRICFFRDIELGELPHNLLLDLKLDFISKKQVLIDGISFEYFRNVDTEYKIPENPKISMWIPTEGGDFALNNLYAKLENSIDEFSIDTDTSTIPSTPLNSNISIIVAHGENKISSFPSFFTASNRAITNIDNVIVKTDIIILFVCHSGSGEKSILREKLNSFVRDLLKKGVKAVIAPFWALNINIPPIWLPMFLKSFLNGIDVSNSFYKANMEVYSIHKNPSDWCCLHFYGNPYLQCSKGISIPQGNFGTLKEIGIEE